MEELTADDPRRIGPYTITHVLGQGGMGRVFLGRDDDGRLAAVKVVHADLARSPLFRKRFRREVQTSRAVTGAHIAAVLDADSEAEQPWLATEYVPAPSLHAVVEEHGPLSALQVRGLGADLSRALAAIHEAGLVHRDVKPPNVLLPEQPDGADTGLKLIDFGIARSDSDTTMTQTGIALGTPCFMAPEQLRGRREQVGPPADVFALGCVLVFAATGDYAFGEGGPDQLHYRIVHEAPQLRGVAANLRPLIRRCLAKDPADRPRAAELVELFSAEPGEQDAEALGDTEPYGEPDVEPHESGNPAAAPAPGTPRRRRALIIGVGTAAAVLAVAGIIAADAGGGGTPGRATAGGRSDSPTGPTRLSGGSGDSDGSSASNSPVSAPGPTPAGNSGAPADGAGSAPPGGTPTGTSGVDTGTGQQGAAPGQTTPGRGSTTVVVPTASTSVRVTVTSKSAPPPSRTTAAPPPPITSAPPPQPPASTDGPPATPGGIAWHPGTTQQPAPWASWNTVPGATDYNVEVVFRSPNQTQTTDVAQPSVNEWVIPGDTVCFRVQAHNARGLSAWSGQSCFKT